LPCGTPAPRANIYYFFSIHFKSLWLINLPENKGMLVSMHLIIYAHPDNASSHSAAVLKLVREHLDSKGSKYRVIDLYAEGFDPVMPVSEYKWQSGKGKGAGPEQAVLGYQQAIKDSDVLVFILPVWWYSQPAILKGFLDRVFTPGFAYKFKKPPSFYKYVQPAVNLCCRVGFLAPLIESQMPIEKFLTGRRAVVISTYGGSSEGFYLFGKPNYYSLDKAVLEFCGISPVSRINWWEARHSTDVPGYVREQIIKAL